MGATRGLELYQPLVSDQLWELLEPLIPPPPPAKNGRTGKPRVDDWAALEGIVRNRQRYRLEETAHRAGLRLRGHSLASVAGMAGGRSLGEAPPRRARPAGPGRPARLVPDLSGLCERPGDNGGELTGPNPTDRGKLGMKSRLQVTADGLPLAVAITGATRQDSMPVERILDGLASVNGRGRGRPRWRPGKLHADKAHDNRRVRRYLRRRGISARIARIGVNSSERSVDTAGSWNEPSGLPRVWLTL